MNLAAALSLMAAVMGVCVGLLSMRLRAAPGWDRYRVLPFIAVTATAYAVLDMMSAIQVPDVVVVRALRVQGTAASIHVAAWILYASRQLDARPNKIERIMLGVLGVTAVAALIPGALLTDEVGHVRLDWLNVTYSVPKTTPLGDLSYVLQIGTLLLPFWRYVRAARAGIPHAGAHAAALATMIAAGINDALVGSGTLHGPGLLSSGVMLSIAVIGASVTHAFVESAHALDRLSRRLEQEVDVRTNELMKAEATILRVEKLAALGQLAAGVAHEINNPTAAVAGNVEYLRESLAHGETPDDAVACLDESLESIDRIKKIVRELLHAGRAAATTPNPDVSSSVRHAVEQALTLARAHVEARADVKLDVPEYLLVRAEEASLVQVLVNLVVNAAQAIPRDRRGVITISASEHERRVHLEVSDDGTGMSEETKRRLFEPFYTTKAFGEGTGLGLSVSLGLVRSMGGDIEATSVPGRTTMRLSLVRTSLPSSSARVRISHARPRRTLLLVDDEPDVRKALARSLRASFSVILAEGPEDALTKLGDTQVDVILSDAQMPQGGGARLYREIAARWPEMANRVVFFTGGINSATSIAQLGRPVLAKPLVLEELFATLDRLSV